MSITPKEFLEMIKVGVDFSDATGLNINGSSDATAYPQGLSYQWVSSGTWPDTYGSVYTLNMHGVRFSQIFISKNGYAAYIRGLVGNGPTLSSWTLLYNTEWTALPFANGWTDYGSIYSPAAYRKDEDGAVRLRGLIRPGTANLICTLPSGYISTNTRFLPTVADNALAYVIALDTGGISTGSAHRTNNTWISLDGITFPTT